MEATDQIDRLIESRSKGRETANAEAERVKADDARRLSEWREANRRAWAEHYRRLVVVHIKMARDFRRRARELETNQPKREA